MLICALCKVKLLTSHCAVSEDENVDTRRERADDVGNAGEDASTDRN